MSNEAAGPKGWRDITWGEWHGWRTWEGDPFETWAGPFYYREVDGERIYGMRVTGNHLNGGETLHGGALMTFGDYCLFVIAREALAGAPAVTTNFSAELVGAARKGDLIECRGEVVRATRMLVFARGLIRRGDEPIMSFSGTLKKIAPRP